MSKVEITNKELIEKLNDEFDGFISDVFFIDGENRIEVYLFITAHKAPENIDKITTFKTYFFENKIFKSKTSDFIVYDFEDIYDSNCHYGTGTKIKLTSVAELSM